MDGGVRIPANLGRNVPREREGVSTVIARSDSDEAIHLSHVATWTASLAMTAGLRAAFGPAAHDGLAPTARPPESFSHHDKLSAETAAKTSRSSAQRRRNRPHRPASLFSSPAPGRSPQSSGDESMSKRI